MPTWDRKLVDHAPAATPRLKVFSVAVPYTEHERFKRLVNRAVEKHQQQYPGEYTHDAVRLALEQYVRGAR